MPFITEEIWQNLPHQGESITVAKWPVKDAVINRCKSSRRNEAISGNHSFVRNSRAEVNTPLSKKIKMIVKAKDDHVLATLEKNKAYLERFCNPEELMLATEVATPEKAMTAIVTGAEIILPLEGLINLDEEIARLQKELDKLIKK